MLIQEWVSTSIDVFLPNSEFHFDQILLISMLRFALSTLRVVQSMLTEYIISNTRHSINFYFLNLL